MAILVGCDFAEGVKGVGIQRAMQHVRQGGSPEGYPNSNIALKDIVALRANYRPPDVSRIEKLRCVGPDLAFLIRTFGAEFRQDVTKIRQQVQDYSDDVHKLAGTNPLRKLLMAQSELASCLYSELNTRNSRFRHDASVSSITVNALVLGSTEN